MTDSRAGPDIPSNRPCQKSSLNHGQRAGRAKATSRDRIDGDWYPDGDGALSLEPQAEQG